MPMDTADVPVEELTEAEYNPRRGNVEVIKESLVAHGQFRPIVVRRDTNEVLAGNHTLKAARELGWRTIGVVYVDADDDAAKRILIADNRTADLATNDDELLSKLLQDLDGLDGTGYDADDLTELKRITGELADDAMAKLGEALGDAPDYQHPPRNRPEFAFQVSFPVTAAERAEVMGALMHLVHERELDGTSAALVELAREYNAEHDVEIDVPTLESTNGDG